MGMSTCLVLPNWVIVIGRRQPLSEEFFQLLLGIKFEESHVECEKTYSQNEGERNQHFYKMALFLILGRNQGSPQEPCSASELNFS
jgi:hypothetical protein